MFSPDGRLSRIMSMIFDILVIGLLWMLLCIPVITAGASTTAAYYTMSKVVRFQSGYIREEFMRSFRQNLKQSLLPSILMVIVFGILTVDIIYLWRSEGRIYSSLFIVMVGISFLMLALVIYLYPFMSRFTKDLAGLVKMSGFAAFRFLPVTIAVMIVLALLIIGIYLMPWFIVVAPGIYMYLLTYPMELIMKRFMKRPAPGEAGCEAWYWGKG